MICYESLYVKKLGKKFRDLDFIYICGMTEFEFDEKMLELDALDVYDGRGTFDLYVCDRCNEFKVTTYKDKGVTPFIIQCDKCKSGVGCMKHVRSFDNVKESVVYYEWRRPTFAEFQEMGDRMKEHVLSGGLVLDKNPRNINGYL